MSRRGAPEMEMLQPIFNWLCTLNIFQEGYIAKKKKGSVILNEQAVNAVSTGHVFYFVCYNILYQRGQPLAAQLTGNPGEALAPQSVHYNWTVLSDVFGMLGLNVDADHKDLLVSGDVAILIDLLVEMYNSFSGEPAVGSTMTKTQRSKKKMLKKSDSREGAKSVDSGLEGYRSKIRGRRTVEEDLEYAKEKHELRKIKEQEEEEKKQAVEEKAKERAKRIAEKLQLESRIDCHASEEPQKNISAYKSHANRGNVQMCHSIVLDLVARVESGEAQAELVAREKRRQEIKKQLEDRKKGGHRLVDTTTCSVHVPRKANHKNYLLIKSLVETEIVELCMRPGALKELLAKEKEREYERNLLVTQKHRLNDKMAQPLRVHKKHELVLKERREEEARAKAKHEAKMARIRAENAQIASDAGTSFATRQHEKELEARLKAEKANQKEALLQLYYAEQKAKVTENARQKEARRLQEEEAKILEEKRDKMERQRRGQELNAKLREKQVKKLQGGGKMAAPSLSPVSFGTGEHAAYFGETLGWQYLTETEFDLAQVLCQVRADPTCAAAWIDQRLGGIKGRALWLTDDEGRRLPMSITEGPSAHEEALSFLQKQKPQPAPGDVSIGLSLAARHHAIDLAYHGIAESSVHTGTDGSTLTQRVLKYGTPALRPGHSEIVFAVVRPSTFRYNPADILASMVVDDGNPSREARAGIFHPVMVESIGVGHAIANLGDKYCVEVVVFLLAFSFIDKPVAWMSQSHYSGVDAVAAPFLDGNRSLHPKFQRKRDIYITTNLVIGKANESNPDIDRLFGEKMGKRQHGAGGGYAAAAEGDEPIIKPIRAKSKTPAQLEHHSPSSAQVQQQEEQDRKAALRDQKKDYRLRLARFYSKYASHKLPIVDAALTMYEGKEEEMFFALIRKYGPEPYPDEDVGLRDDWDDVATEYNEEHKEKQREEKEKYDKYQANLEEKEREEAKKEKAKKALASSTPKKSRNNSRTPKQQQDSTVSTPKKEESSPKQQEEEPTTPDSRSSTKPNSSSLRKATSSSSQRKSVSLPPKEQEGDEAETKPTSSSSKESRHSAAPGEEEQNQQEEPKQEDEAEARSQSSTHSGAADPDADQGAPTPSKNDDSETHSQPGQNNGVGERQNSTTERDEVRSQTREESPPKQDPETLSQTKSAPGDEQKSQGSAVGPGEEEQNLMSSQSFALHRAESFVVPVGAELSPEQHDRMVALYNDVQAAKEEHGMHSSEYYLRVLTLAQESNRAASNSPKIESTSTLLLGRVAKVVDGVALADRKESAEYRKMLSDGRSKASFQIFKKLAAVATLPEEVRGVLDAHSTHIETVDVDEELAALDTWKPMVPPATSAGGDEAPAAQEEVKSHTKEETKSHTPDETKSQTQEEVKSQGQQEDTKSQDAKSQQDETKSQTHEEVKSQEDSKSQDAKDPETLSQTKSAPGDEQKSQGSASAPRDAPSEDVGEKQEKEATSAPTLTQDERYRRRLERLYKAHVPEKVGQVDKMLGQYKGKEESMFRALTKKYGPEPPIPEDEQEPQNGSSAPQSPLSVSNRGSVVKDDDGTVPMEEPTEEEMYQQYKKRLTRLYEAYCPEKVSQVDKMLGGYKGREESMFKALTKKYGPEPLASSSN